MCLVLLHAHPPVFGGFESPAVPLLGSQRAGELMGLACHIFFFLAARKETAALPVIDNDKNNNNKAVVVCHINGITLNFCSPPTT